MYKVLLLSVFTVFLSACSFFQSEPTRVENPVVKGINYVGVTVSNVEASSTLYQKAADLKRVHSAQLNDSEALKALLGREEVEAQTVLLESVNAQLNFMSFSRVSEAAKAMLPVDVHGPGIAHVCYQVNQKTQAYDTFLAGGARHIGDKEMVQLNASRPVEYAYAKDGDGIMFEVEHVDVEALELLVPPENDYRIRHVSLATPNIDRLVAFYSVLLETSNPRRFGGLIKIAGEKVDKVSGLEGSELEMAWFQTRNLELELIQYHSHPTTIPSSPRPLDAPGYNSIVFEVTDLAAAKQKLIEAGGTIVTDTLEAQGGSTFYGRDLDGNLLGFQTSDTMSPFSAAKYKNNGI